MTRTLAVATLALGLAGCHLVFPIEGTQRDGGGDDDESIDADIADADPLTADEDSDGVPNVIDNCPGIANAGQANMGELSVGQALDMVGDACDPHPNRSGDERALQYYFNASSDLDPNLIKTGSWQQGPGYAEVSIGPATAWLEGVARVNPDADDTIEVGFDVVSGGPALAVGVFMDGIGGNTCYMSEANDMLAVIDGSSGGFASVSHSSLASPQIVLTRDVGSGANMLHCGVVGTGTQVNLGSYAPRTGAFGVFVSDGTIRVRYIMTYLEQFTP